MRTILYLKSKKNIVRFSILALTISCITYSCKKNTKVVEATPRMCVDNIDNQKIIDINNFTYNIANKHDQFKTFTGVRALALVHLSIHDIFNVIEPKYETYHYKEISEVCEPIAAAIESTRVILTNIYPNKKDTIIKVCNEWLSSIKDDEEKAKSVYLGRSVANSYLKLRKNDGYDRQGEYTPMTKPGNYQYTPGFFWVWKPDFSAVKTFTLDSLSQFRSPEPPPIDSEEYAKSYNEVKEYGVKESKVRSEDQTSIAHWWSEFGEHSWNRIGRITAAEKKLSIVETNRMFALINMNLYDLYLASFDSKYFYDTWRPYTAILEGENDNNPNTQGDKKWEPEMQTLPWPEYPSAHAAVGAAGAEIMSSIYGTNNVSFTMKSTAALPNFEEKHYDDLEKADEDCAESRIMNGFHFRFSTDEGRIQGKNVAKHTIENFLKPLK